MPSKHTLHSPITNLPPELFANFCHFLPPVDLLTLSQVCHKFRGYLCAPNSFSTQQIWKESRLQFMPEKDTPPVGISEEKYVELLMAERGCQICKCSKKCKIYLEFEVRCCKKCFLKRIVTREELITNKYPRKFLNIMPYTYYDNSKYYWIEQIDFTYSQYCGLSKENLQSWLDGKKHTSHSIMEYVKQLKPKRKNGRIIKSINQSIDRMNESIGRMNECIERSIKSIERLNKNLESFNIKLNNININPSYSIIN